MTTYDAVDLIRAKRDGREHTDPELRWLVDAYTKGVVADEQMSAWLMAVVWRGLSDNELASYTDAMVRSGQRLDLAGVGRPTVDKHSTGGVGDCVSLVLAPLVAACGAAVPQLSGRGLGHTGGTLDKLEAIAGFRVNLSNDEITRQLADKAVGAVICAAGAELAPADRKLYALRDVTGTVESVPLIAASIMSKKIAEGTESLVLDVKVGSGAFMRSLDMARDLAARMVAIGTAHGVRAVALLTRMDSPLARAAGNGLEVEESVAALRGERADDPLVEVTLALGREMTALAGVDADVVEALADGSALRHWESMVSAQGGNPAAPTPTARFVREIHAPADGVVDRVDALAVGVAAWRLGAGRARKEDPVSPGAGVRCLARPGDKVAAGQPVFELHTDEQARFDRAQAALNGGWSVGSEPPAPVSWVIERIDASTT
jgi:thymidine phosphorylase